MVRIVTRYESHPGSNVGKYRARAFGRTASARTDQACTDEQNHLQAAWRLTQKFRDLGFIPATTIYDDLVLVEVRDDGSRVWTIARQSRR